MLNKLLGDKLWAYRLLSHTWVSRAQCVAILWCKKRLWCKYLIFNSAIRPAEVFNRVRVLSTLVFNMSAFIDICRAFVYAWFMSISHTDMILNLARSNGLLSTRDVDATGAPRALLARLTHKGQLVRLGRGLYALPDRPPSEHDSLAEVSAKSSTGVVCLISALRFHALTTQQSSEIWLAIPHKAHPPRMDFPPLRIVRMSGAAMTQGIDEIDIACTTVRVFCVAKTVADCFKFRNKVGLDVALEALREAWQGRRVNMDELWRYAEICRVANVMRPYMESLVAG